MEIASAAMFNLVFESNEPSVRLWRSLGFKQIGRIPQAGLLAHGEYADALMLYYDLTADIPVAPTPENA